ACPLRDRRDVLLVVLAEIGSERVGDRALLAHPRERAASIEAAGERDPDPLADGERVEDDAAVGDHDAPRWWRNCSSRSAPVMPSRAASKIVFSPATVPATSARPASSIASAWGAARPFGVVITCSCQADVIAVAQRCMEVVCFSLRRRSAVPW